MSSTPDTTTEARERRTGAAPETEELIDLASVAIIEFDLEGTGIRVNQQWCDLMGVDLAPPIPGAVMLDRIHPDDRDFASRKWLESLETGDPYDLVVRVLHPNGEVRTIQNRTEPLLQEDGTVKGFVASVVDISRSLRADQFQRREHYRAYYEQASVGHVVFDLGYHIVEANQAFCSIVQRTASELVGRTALEILHPDDAELLAGRVTELLRTGEAYVHDEVRLIRADGTHVWVSGGGSLVHDPDGAVRYVQAMVYDITDRRHAEERARQLARIVESTSDLVGTVDPESGSLLYLNRAARKLFALTDEQLGSIDARQIYTEPSSRIWETDVAISLEMGRTWTGELDMISADGEVLHIQQSISGDFDERGAVQQVFFVGRDVTEQRRREVDLAHQATHDPLTDLPNRALLLQLIEHALHRAERDHGLIALLFLDLDRFKSVNDSLGHDAGDDLLVEVARRIAAVLRPSDTVARLGGDEFVVLCEEVRDEHQAVAITQRVTAAIEQRPFEVSGAVLPMTASVGIALSGDRDAHPEGLLRDADAAMYRAKDRGRARHELFDDEMRRRTTHRLELADELALAIERGQITVHYQPIIDLTTGRVEGVEALARWDHPQRGTLSPIEFIGLAEETGLIVGLGLSVLSRACDQARRWEVELGNRAPKVHVNLSARQLTAANLPRLVQGVLDQSLIDPQRLCLEVTESVLMDDAASSVTVLAGLKDLGVELAIDDFGTGYSSLAYLRRFPVDVLKIDRSFVDGLGPDADDSAIVSVIVSLARTLGLECVAEGVETIEQLSGLRSLGCEQAQGYYFARPHPVPAVNRFLTTTFPLDS